MGRVHRQRHASLGSVITEQALARHRRENLKKPSYKVIIEEFSEKKILKTSRAFNRKAPQGYTFIPAGDPQLTERLKQVAREDGSTVYIVSNSIDTKALSHEVGRIGYHFSSAVVEKACASLEVTLTAAGRVEQSHFADLQDDLPANELERIQVKGKKNRRYDLDGPQAIIDTQAREAIRDLFPKIPAYDLHNIIALSFQKGANLVGTAGDTPLVRRAQLAVMAYIRHHYTKYDDLLKVVDWGESRRRVEQQTLDKLLSWRNDTDDDTHSMRDVLREVIVLDDEEEEELEEGEVERDAPENSGHADPSSRSNQSRAAISSNIDSHVRNQAQVQAMDLTTEAPPRSALELQVPYLPTQIFHNYTTPERRLRERRRETQRQQRWQETVRRQERHRHSALTSQASPSTYDHRSFRTEGFEHETAESRHHLIRRPTDQTALAFSRPQSSPLANRILNIPRYSEPDQLCRRNVTSDASSIGLGKQMQTYHQSREAPNPYTKKEPVTLQRQPLQRLRYSTSKDHSLAQLHPAGSSDQGNRPQSDSRHQHQRLRLDDVLPSVEREEGELATEGECPIFSANRSDQQANSRVWRPINRDALSQFARSHPKPAFYDQACAVEPDRISEFQDPERVMPQEFSLHSPYEVDLSVPVQQSNPRILVCQNPAHPIDENRPLRGDLRSRIVRVTKHTADHPFQGYIHDDESSTRGSERRIVHRVNADDFERSSNSHTNSAHHSKLPGYQDPVALPGSSETRYMYGESTGGQRYIMRPSHVVYMEEETVRQTSHPIRSNDIQSLYYRERVSRPVALRNIHDDRYAFDTGETSRQLANSIQVSPYQRHGRDDGNVEFGDRDPQHLPWQRPSQENGDRQDQNSHTEQQIMYRQHPPKPMIVLREAEGRYMNPVQSIARPLPIEPFYHEAYPSYEGQYGRSNRQHDDARLPKVSVVREVIVLD